MPAENISLTDLCKKKCELKFLRFTVVLPMCSKNALYMKEDELDSHYCSINVTKSTMEQPTIKSCLFRKSEDSYTFKKKKKNY